VSAPTSPSPCDPFHGIDLFDKATDFRPATPQSNVLGSSTGTLAECAQACLDLGQCKSLTFAPSAGACTIYGGKHKVPGSSSNQPLLATAAGFDYYERAPCRATCPADYQAQFTHVPQTRPKDVTTWIVSFVATVPANGVSECFAACGITYSCKSFTVVTDNTNANYGKCQLYSKPYKNPLYQTTLAIKDHRYIDQPCTPTCPATLMERFTLTANKRPSFASNYFASYTFADGTAAEGADACAARCHAHGGFACRAFTFMDQVTHAAFGQCRLYPLMYTASFLSANPTEKDYYAYEGHRCSNTPAPDTYVDGGRFL